MTTERIKLSITAVRCMIDIWCRMDSAETATGYYRSMGWDVQCEHGGWTVPRSQLAFLLLTL